MGEVRKIKKDEIPAMLELGAYAFNVEISERWRKRFDWIVKHSDGYGYFEGETLTSQLLATPFKVNFHGVEYKMAGIGCVSSYPEYRGQGSITALIKTMLVESARNKVALSYLAPFSYPFYRRYGYEQIFEQIEYKVNPQDWPISKASKGRIHRVTWKEAKAVIQKIYIQKKDNQRGGVIRSDWWLEYKFDLGNEYLFALYENDLGEIDGYLVYQVSGERFTIYEWSCLTGEGYSMLNRFIGSHNGATQEFFYKKGFSGEDNSFLMPAPLLQMQLTPYMMGRIVDIETFITDYPFQYADEEYTYYLTIKDEYANWNEGTWKLILKNGRTFFEKVANSKEIDKEKMMSAGIQEWTQLFMGYRSGEALSFYGKLIGELEEIRQLDQLLPKGKPILEDYF
ncbi:GNAT family N-acetyltransferase [Enterococcus sp. LJL51]|uniref:GNAT family N-acetyltransferase n=1 Tax=Enterococcus sp. LJL51 TaxID=3416656 RepID=UPI003CE7734E